MPRRYQVTIGDDDTTSKTLRPPRRPHRRQRRVHRILEVSHGGGAGPALGSGGFVAGEEPGGPSGEGNGTGDCAGCQ
jgi:hypothetical protein